MEPEPTEPAPASQPKREQWPQRLFSSVLIYVVAFFVPFLLESASDLNEYLPHFAQRLMDTGAWYQRLTSSGPRDLLPRYTALVQLDTDSLPASLLRNVCNEERNFLADLITKLANSDPNVIVLDFVFLEESCDPNQRGPGSGTAKLSEALTYAAERCPVVIGQEVYSKEDGRYVKESIPIASQRLEHGLVLFNRDPRKVPLTWYVHPNSSDDAVPQDTLAYRTALVYRSAYPDQGQQLKDVAATGQQPFTNFVATDQFASIKAIDVVCDAAHARNKDWKSCLDKPGNSKASAKLHGKIAVVGWREEDRHHTILGEFPGYVIHANYIEALLDQHYLKTIDMRLQIGLSALWYLLMDIPFWTFSKETARPLAIALGVWIAVAFLVYYIAVVNLGFYTTLLVPSLAALLIRATYRWHESREKEGA